MTAISSTNETNLNNSMSAAQDIALGTIIKNLGNTDGSLGPLSFATTAGTGTTGSMITTGTTWVTHATAGACAGKILASSTATTGDYATWRIRGRSDVAVADVYNVASVAGINSSASANHADYANLYGVQGLAQPNAFNQANASNIICGVYSCMDKTGTSAGKAWSMWIDDHSTTAKAASHYLLRMSQNALGGTPVDIDGAISIQTSRLPVLFNFEQVQGFFSTASGATLTATHKIKVKIDGDATAYYILVGTV